MDIRIYRPDRERKRAAFWGGPLSKCRLGVVPELYRQDMNRAGGAEPDDVGLAGLGVGYLAILRAIVLRQVPDHFADIRDAGRAERMPLREQSARNVDRIVAAEARMHAAARVDERTGFAVAAQSEVFVVHELRSREAVMQFGERDVLGSDAGLLVRLLGRAPRERADVGQREVAIGPRIRGEHGSRHLRALASTGELLQLVFAHE